MNWEAAFMGLVSVMAFGGFVNTLRLNRRINELEEAMGLQGIHTNPESIKILSESGLPQGRLDERIGDIERALTAEHGSPQAQRVPDETPSSA